MDKAYKTPAKDLAARAQEHYIEASDAICHFNSLIPRAIALWERIQMQKEAEEHLEYEEMISQPYANCCFSAGWVRGHPVDTLYLKLDRPADGEPLIILLRPDEAAAIAWCLTGVLWTHLDFVNNPNDPPRPATNKSEVLERDCGAALPVEGEHETACDKLAFLRGEIKWRAD